MKNLFTRLLFLGGFVTYLFLLGNSGGAIAGVTGAPPNEQTCARSGCHSGTVNSGSATISIKFGEDVTSYIPDETYGVNISIDGAQDASKNGFEIVALDENENNVGEWILAGNNDVRSRSGNNREYVTQTSSGNSKSAWTIDWKAPNMDAGNITFYLAYNDANGNGGTSGDDIYTTSLSVRAGGSTAVQDVIAIEELRTFPNPFTEFLTLQVTMSQEEHLTATLVNALGQGVHHLFSNDLLAGAHTIPLNIPDELSSGLYFLQIRSNNGEVKSIPVMKQ